MSYYVLGVLIRSLTRPMPGYYDPQDTARGYHPDGRYSFGRCCARMWKTR